MELTEVEAMEGEGVLPSPITSTGYCGTDRQRKEGRSGFSGLEIGEKGRWRERTGESKLQRAWRETARDIVNHLCWGLGDQGEKEHRRRERKAGRRRSHRRRSR
eukprot:3429432-Rhodomonas_salina.1